MKKFVMSMGLSLIMGGMLIGGYVTQASTTNVKVETTQQETGNVKTYKDGDCTLTLDTDTGALTVGPGALEENPDISADSNLSMYLGDDASKVTSIKFEPGVIAPVNFREFFKDMSNVTSIDGLNNIDVSNVQTFLGLFQGLYNVKTIDISQWQNSIAEYGRSMFDGDSSLEKVTLGNIFHPGGTGSYAENGLNTQDLFTGDYSLHNIVVPDGVSVVLGYVEAEGSSLSNLKFNKYYDSKDNLTNKTSSLVQGPKNVTGMGAGEVIVNEFIKYKQDGVEKEIRVSDHKNVPNGGVDESIEVPQIKGYHPNVDYVDFTIPTFTGDELNKVQKVYYPNPNPDPDSDDPTVNYVKEDPDPVKPNKPVDNGGSSTNNSVKDVNLLIATYPDEGLATLYHDDTTKVTNRALRNATDWKIDKEKTIGKTTYYRVSTHEWVKDNEGYLYEQQVHIIKTGNTTAHLVDSHGKKVTNRGLSANTEWLTDHLAHINGKDYYRVSTNEFVSVADVTVAK